eukprot:2322891-Amphidinium_carterae.2
MDESTAKLIHFPHFSVNATQTVNSAQRMEYHFEQSIWKLCGLMQRMWSLSCATISKAAPRHGKDLQQTAFVGAQ